MREFVAAINEHDLDRLLGLMTEDHVFVDSGGATVRGREAMGGAWQGYFGVGEGLGFGPIGGRWC